MKREIIKTADGSPTIYLPELDEHYHSTHGAVQEAMHVFIRNGLEKYLNNNHVSILEVGFGSGLNALLTCLEVETHKHIQIHYTGIESDPLSESELNQINYSEQIKNSLCQDYFQKIHNAKWNENVKISDSFELLKVKSRIQDFNFTPDHFDIIYYDAFGPRAQAEMWTKDCFEPLFDSLKSHGLLVTYCAQGQFKRNLREIGFQVEAVPGPPGKREMTVARKFKIN